jgi:dihydrofolate reductase
MKVILYMAMSIDGKIAGSDDDVSWVEDEDVERMNTLMRETGVMLMGSNTYESLGDELPNDEALQIVLTRNEDLLNNNINNVRFYDKSIKSVLTDLAKEGYETVLLAGGGELNTSFLKEDLIDEIRIIIKPLVLGSGKPIFNDISTPKNFEFQSSEDLEYGSVELLFTKL